MLPNFHFSIERWRKNEEYGVWVSTHGRVRLIQNKEFLNIRIDASGYCCVFTPKGKQLVHRLVAYTWLGGKRNDKYNIDHINSNKRDNSIKNLRWIPVELNQEYARFTFTDVKNSEENPPVQAIEKDEDMIAILKSTNDISKYGEYFRKLFDNKQIVLWADNKIAFTEYAKINTQLKIGHMPNKKDFMNSVVSAIQNQTLYCNHLWNWTLASETNKDFLATALETFYKSNDYSECGKLLFALLGYKKISIKQDHLIIVKTPEQLYAASRSGCLPKKNEFFSAVAKAIKNNNLYLGHYWEIEENE